MRSAAPQRPTTLAELSEYWCQQRTGPFEVDFRKLMPVSRTGAATHYVAPYPGKLIPHIPRAIIALAKSLVLPGGVLDPCCGSGTVLLEGCLAGQYSVGVDINPFASLISRVKTTPIDHAAVQRILMRLGARCSKAPFTTPNVVNLDYWFTPSAIKRLATMRTVIQRIQRPEIRELFMVAFARVVQMCSLADPRMPVPVRPNLNRTSIPQHRREELERHLAQAKNPDVISMIQRVVGDMLRSLSTLPPSIQPAHVITGDARKLALPEQFGLILTSPPYGSAQKYIRSNSLVLGWLGLADSSDLAGLERLSIGREHVQRKELGAYPYPTLASAAPIIDWAYGLNPTRAHLAANYLADLASLFRVCRGHLSPKGAVVMILADTSLLGRRFQTGEYAVEIAARQGLVLTLELRDRIRGRGLLTKRRSVSPVIREERIMVFQEAGT